MSSLKSSLAARSSDRLYESRRRLPEMPRTFIGLRLHQVQLGRQRDVVRQGRLAVRERVVPVQTELRAVDRRRQLETEAHTAVGIVRGLADRALEADGERGAPDRQLAVDRDLAAGAADLGRRKGNLRRSLDVEEVGGLEVGGQVLVLHRDP